MNYPIWELYYLNGGTLVAIISVLHAYIAHLAVGGGLFIWLTDLKAYKENDSEIDKYVRKHTWFFLLLTMVFGGVSGVGIWFIIALVNPAATSSLIHNFVFGWAIEWVFFLGEITALLIYHYKFDSLKRKERLNIAFLYFLFAWLSMVVINGILAFMLTPGTWLETGGFWDGFFNPSYFSSLLFRTCAAIMIAGLFGYLTVVFLKESEFRSKMLRYCSQWVLYPIAGLIIFGMWYFYTIPEGSRITTFFLNAQTAVFVNIFILSSIIIFLFGVYYSFRTSPSIQRILVFILVLIGLSWYGGFEYIREYARKPYIINEYMYSTSILKSEEAVLNKEGVLANAKWSSIKSVTVDNFIDAGRELFNLQCSSCHTINGIKNDIVEKTNSLTYMGILSHLTGQGKIQDYMPQFIGTMQEMEALAGFITKELNGKTIEKDILQYEPQPRVNEIPPFDSENDEYVLLVWNDLGMHCISDSDPWFIILPPANTLEAQLIKRGELPEIITEGFELRYKVEAGFENPSRHVEFWKYAKNYFDVDLPENVGLAENGMSGVFQLDEDKMSFIAAMIPVVPYNDDGSFNPYPQFTIEAVELATNGVKATTKAITPTSTEMGCKNCHGGGWRIDGVSGLSDETAINILQAHDRLSGTDLYQSALDGQPQLCQDCHADPALNADGKPGHNNLPTSIHGWHANYMFAERGKACVMCHPAASNGNTRCNRGVHPQLGLDCTNCHGTIEDHAISLLKNQIEIGSTARMMKNLQTTYAESVAEINPRLPWINQPDCLTCHQDFEQPVPEVFGFNTWNEDISELYRNRSDYAGIRCIACHNSTHANYPAFNAFGRNLDNTQPLQYSGLTLPIGSEFSCKVCHTIEMDFSIHHENMLRSFRNQAILNNESSL